MNKNRKQCDGMGWSWVELRVDRIIRITVMRIDNKLVDN